MGKSRAQVSFEFLIYTALSVAAMAAAAGIFAYANQASSAMESRGFLEQLVAALNSNMAYQSSTFSAYVPAAACNSTISGSSITGRLGTFQLAGRLEVQPNGLCAASGRVASMSMSMMYNGTHYLSVS